MDVENIFRIPENLPRDEFVERVFEDDAMRIERIISSGHRTDWYDQKELEYVLLLQGNAILEFKDTKVELVSGDHLIIRPHNIHRVAYTSSEPKAIWLCVFRKY